MLLKNFFKIKFETEVLITDSKKNVKFSNKMKNAAILHGTDSSPDANWFQWLKKELDRRGYRVWLPQLPSADKPSVCIYNPFLESGWEYNEETVMIGHSSGAVAILNFLNKMPDDFHIKKALLVGSFKDDLGWDALQDLFTYEWDFEKIKSKSDEFVFIHSDNDPYCPLEHAEYLSKKLDGELVVMTGQKHFSTGTVGEKYTQFPELLKYL